MPSQVKNANIGPMYQPADASVNPYTLLNCSADGEAENNCLYLFLEVGSNGKLIVIAILLGKLAWKLKQDCDYRNKI